MVRSIVTGVCMLALVSVFMFGRADAANILFMQQPNSPDLDDQFIEYLESLGHDVEAYDTSANDAIEQIDFAEAADVVYVTESLGSGTTHDGLETNIKEVETPQIWAEAYAWDEAAMTADTIHEDFGNTNRDVIEENPIAEFEDERDHINIVNPDHPLAGGLSGRVQVYEDPYPVNWAFIETMGPGVDVIATADEAGEYATLFAYEKGAELEDGTASAGLRIGFWLGQGSGSNVLFGAPVYDNLHANGLKLIETAINYALGLIEPGGPPSLMAGDSNQDFKFDQLDLVQVQIAATYLSGQPATWGQGDWNGAPGGEQGSPPAGDGVFNQVDIIAALGPSHYLTGPYAAIADGGARGDGQTSIVYNPTTGELAVDAPAGTELTSVNIDSAGSIFTGEAALNLGGSFDNDGDDNIFKATFGSSFGSLSFGNVAQTGLSKDFVLNDFTVIGSLAGGGDLGNVDLIYVPEPSTLWLAVFGVLAGASLLRPIPFKRA